jgi:serine/threonine protein kinase
MLTAKAEFGALDAGPQLRVVDTTRIVARDCTVYQLQATSLGSGTSGTVFIAQSINVWTSKPEDVAVKRFKDHGGSAVINARDRWGRETYLLTQLGDLGRTIFHCRDSFEHSGKYYTISDLLGADLLSDIVWDPSERAQLPRSQWGNSFNWIRTKFPAILRQLILLDAVNFIVLDIKPENILHIGGPDSDLTLIDCGNGMFVYEAGPRRGTDGYCPRECYLKNAKLTTKADMWSLGCTLFEMFTGEPLFDHQVVAYFDFWYIRTITNEKVRKRVRAGVWAHARQLGCPWPQRDPEVCEFVELLIKMLDVSPRLRIGPAEALGMPFWRVRPVPGSQDAD